VGHGVVKCAQYLNKFKSIAANLAPLDQSVLRRRRKLKQEFGRFHQLTAPELNDSAANFPIPYRTPAAPGLSVSKPEVFAGLTPLEWPGTICRLINL